MHRQILLGCLPYLGLMLASFVVAWLMVRLTRARPDWRQLLRLHGDQRGAVQSLSFVLTVPVFIMVMMFIVQLSQLTIGKVVVEYAAFAAVRSAQVWIPARVAGGEEENQISTFCYLRSEAGSDGWLYHVYVLNPGSPKYEKIKFAAIQACLPICPSRDVGANPNAAGNSMAASFGQALLQWAPALAANPRIPARVQNKLAYALANTAIQVEIRHKDNEPPLQTYLIDPYPTEFNLGEIGWNDQLTVKVAHQFALLPGPGRLLARRTDGAGGSVASASGHDWVADRIQPLSGVYVYSLNSSARLYNEGEKPVLPYSQPMLGPTTSVGASSANARVSGPSQEYLSLLANRPRLGDAADPADDCCQETLPTAEQWTAEQLFSDSSARLPSILRRAQP